MNRLPSEIERIEALFKAISGTLNEFHERGILSDEEYILLIDSVWHALDYGNHLPD